MRQIEPGDPESYQPYRNLLPVVELLIEHGNRYVDGSSGFKEERGGIVCDLELPIDMDLVHREFTFPPTINAGPDGDGILDRSTWCLISGPGERARRRAGIYGTPPE